CNSIHSPCVGSYRLSTYRFPIVRAGVLRGRRRCWSNRAIVFRVARASRPAPVGASVSRSRTFLLRLQLANKSRSEGLFRREAETNHARRVRYPALPSTTQALIPPKPNELLMM